MTTAQVLRLLRKEYGPRKWQPGQDPLSSLIATVLSQNTSDVNSHRAFAALVNRFGSWESVATADVNELAGAIRAGGLADIKARRIKLILHEIEEKHGSLDLSFLDERGIGGSQGLAAADCRGWGRKRLAACFCSPWGNRPCRWTPMSSG